MSLDGHPSRFRPRWLLLAAACLPVLLLAGWLMAASDQRSPALGRARDVLVDGPLRHPLYGAGLAVVISLVLATVLTAAMAWALARRQAQEGRRAATALTASEERTALAVAAADLGTWTWDCAQDQVAGSERCLALLGTAAADSQAEAQPFARFFAAIEEGDRSRIRSAALACASTSEPFELNCAVRSADKRVRWLHIRGRRDRGHAALTFSGILADIGLIKRSEAQRLDLMRRLAEVQDDVERRIARDLHDQVGQTVTGLSLGLKALEQALDEALPATSRQPIGDRVRWLLGLTWEIGRDIQRASADLRPAVLDDLGLPRALDALATEWSERFGISADVQVVGPMEPRLPPEVQTAVYRVVQEALTNVAKHAKARTVGIVFERRQTEIAMIIEDDGTGFDPEAFDGTAERRPLGLLGMRERLNMVGGTLRIESSPAGTSLFIGIDLATAGIALEAA